MSMTIACTPTLVPPERDDAALQAAPKLYPRDYTNDISYSLEVQSCCTNNAILEANTDPNISPNGVPKCIKDYQAFIHAELVGRGPGYALGLTADISLDSDYGIRVYTGTVTPPSAITPPPDSYPTAVAKAYGNCDSDAIGKILTKLGALASKLPGEGQVIGVLLKISDYIKKALLSIVAEYDGYEQTGSLLQPTDLCAAYAAQIYAANELHLTLYVSVPEFNIYRMPVSPIAYAAASNLDFDLATQVYPGETVNFGLVNLLDSSAFPTATTE